MAYTGEYTLEAFSEFLEEQRKMRAEPGEKVSISSRPDVLCNPGRFPACADTAEPLSWALLVPVLGWFSPVPSWFRPHSSCSHVPQPGRHTPTHILVLVTQTPHLPLLMSSLSHHVHTGSEHCQAQRSLRPDRCAAALVHNFSWKKQSPR